jgi:hypothetical protein
VPRVKKEPKPKFVPQPVEVGQYYILQSSGHDLIVGRVEEFEDEKHVWMTNLLSKKKTKKSIKTLQSRCVLCSEADTVEVVTLYTKFLNAVAGRDEAAKQANFLAMRIAGEITSGTRGQPAAAAPAPVLGERVPAFI